MVKMELDEKAIEVLDSRLGECDCCHDIFALSDLNFNGKQFLCKKCKDE
jgi:hypothetical protein